MEPADINFAVFEPVDFFLVVLGGVDGGVWKKVTDGTEDTLGTTNGSEPIADDGNFHYLAPSWRKTALMVRRRIWKSSPSDQFLM